jgi:hypothetical protein
MPMMVWRLFRCLFLVALGCAIGLSIAQTANPEGLLDGQRFVGLNGEKGRQLDPGEHEEILFEKGVFHSVSCDAYGFSRSPYAARAVGDEVHFEAVTSSLTHGQIEWTGVVRGDQAEVTFVWTKERWYWNTRREYWFQGRRSP